MKDNFYITIETMHYADRGEMENVSNLVLFYLTFKLLHEKSTKLSIATCIRYIKLDFLVKSYNEQISKFYEH